MQESGKSCSIPPPSLPYIPPPISCEYQIVWLYIPSTEICVGGGMNMFSWTLWCCIDAGMCWYMQFMKGSKSSEKKPLEHDLTFFVYWHPDGVPVEAFSASHWETCWNQSRAVNADHGLEKLQMSCMSGSVVTCDYLVSVASVSSICMTVFPQNSCFSFWMVTNQNWDKVQL